MHISFYCEPTHAVLLLITSHLLFISGACYAKAGYFDGVPMEYSYEEIFEYSAYDSDIKIPGKHYPKQAYVKVPHDNFRLGYNEPRSHHKDRSIKRLTERRSSDSDYKPGPSFNRYMTRNITVQKGKTASLICKVDNIGDKSVSWLQSDDLRVLSIGGYKYTTNKRISILSYPTQEEWILKISPVTQNDSGKYLCQISTKPVLNFIIQLNVVGYYISTLHSRNFYQLNDEESNSTKDDVTTLQFVYIVNPSIRIPQGDVINLTCVVNNERNPAGIIVWRLNQTNLEATYRRIKITQVEFKNGSLISNLVVIDSMFQDTGSYSCKSPSGEESLTRVVIFPNTTLPSVQSTPPNKQPINLTNYYLLVFLYLWTRINMYIVQLHI